MCDCYKIGGPFIAEDPDCPIHGSEAQAARREMEESRQSLEDRVAELERLVENQARLIDHLRQMVYQTGNE